MCFLFCCLSSHEVVLLHEPYTSGHNNQIHTSSRCIYLCKSLLINCLISLVIEMGIMLKTEVQELNYLSNLFGNCKVKDRVMKF